MKSKQTDRHIHRRKTALAGSLLILLAAAIPLFLLSACSWQSQKPGEPGPNSASSRGEIRISSEGFPLDYGTDVCAWSGQTLETVRYGGRVLLSDQTDLRFDSAENLARWYLANRQSARIASIGVVDFAHGQQLLPPEKLAFLQSRNRPSPGGMNITPVEAANERMRTNIYEAYPGTWMTWAELLERIETETN